MKQADIKDLTTDDLVETLAVQEDLLSKLKITHAVSPIENPLQIKSVRRTIARLKTELNKREQ